MAQARLQIAVEFCDACGRPMDLIGNGLYTCKPCNSEIVKSAILPEEAKMASSHPLEPQRGNESISHCAICSPDETRTPAMLFSACTHGYAGQEGKDWYEREWAAWYRAEYERWKD